MRRTRIALVAPALWVTTCAGPALGAVVPGATAAGDAGVAVAAPPPAQSCVERIGDRRIRPKLTEKFPARGTSGYAALLELEISHGAGETVFPGGLRQYVDSREHSALKKAHFALPHPDGGAPVSVTTTVDGAEAKTSVQIPVVPLPPQPGRNELVLPPLPVAISRASGELMTLCTREHEIVVEDPIANVPEAKPQNNPKPRPQLEEWTAAKHVTYAALAALVVGALAAWLIGRWLRRPKPLPPPPPPRPAWEVALEELHDIRQAELVVAQRYAEHFDRLSDTLRKYLGARYGFDGLESTTRETLVLLRRVTPEPPLLDEITNFLRRSDLVKFARVTPSEAECHEALELAERVVRRTMLAEAAPAAETVELAEAQAHAPPGAPP